MTAKYKTNQRKIIEDFLLNNKDKFVSTDDILEHMKKNNQNVGLTTIYRYLKLLEDNNLVRIETKDHTKYYQYISNECINHFHLKCKKCEKIIHLHCEEFENVSNHIMKEHKFILDYNTIIYGLCDKCSKNAGGQNEY